MPGRRHRERPAVCPGALDAEVSGDRSRVARIAHPSNVETFADAAQIEAIDVAVTGKAERRLRRVQRTDCPLADGGAEKLRWTERRASGDERAAEPAVDVVVEPQRALDAGHGNGRRHATQIDALRRAAKPEG